MEAYQHGIPALYQKVEYIEAKGDAYIDTGVVLTSSSKIQMDCQLTVISGNQCFFCCRTGATTDDTTSNTFFAIGNTFRRDFYGDSKTINVPAPTTSRVMLDVNGESLTMRDLAISSAVPSAPGEAPMNCLLFGSAEYSNGTLSTISNFAKIRLYSCKIWNDGKLVRNFVPCWAKNTTTVAGLFDTVTGTFFGGRNTSEEENSVTFNFVKPESNRKAYIGVKQQVPNYSEATAYLTKHTFSMFFSSVQSDNTWEVKAYGQVQNNVIIEPTGSYGKDNLTEANNYFELTPLIDLEEIDVALTSYATETNYDKIFFSYNGTINSNINGVSGTSSTEKRAILFNVKKGDKLKFWYVKDHSNSATNEKVQFNLILTKQYTIKIETGTFHTEELSKKVKKIYIAKNNLSKFCNSGYIEKENTSKKFYENLGENVIYLSNARIGDLLNVPVINDYQSRFGEYISFKIADINHREYPLNSVTLITKEIIQNMAFDAEEENNINGNPRYIYSNIHQWLNSNATAGNWYSAKHSTDQAPTDWPHPVTHNPYASWAGFLTMLDPRFVMNLVETTLSVFKSDINGDGLETFKAKMFLASLAELGSTEQKNIVEGSILALFRNNGSWNTTPTKECINNAGGYTNSYFTIYKPWYWWLRTPVSISFASNDSNVYVVQAELGRELGTNYYPYTVLGLRPLCNLSGSTLVMRSPGGTLYLV